MSFPPSFGSQLAAIMDVLAKAAVAEITKLVEDGSVVLRMEICRRDGEIQELRRSLELMEAELRKAQEAPTSRAGEALLEQAAAGRLLLQDEKQEATDTSSRYPEQKATHSLCQPFDGTTGSLDIGPVVKPEPPDEAVAAETSDSTATADVGFQVGEPEESLWSAPACSMFEESSAAVKQHVQILSSRAEQYSSHGNSDASFDPLSARAENVKDGRLSLPIKVEVESSSACMGSNTSKSAQSEKFSHLSHLLFSQDQSLQSALQQAGPSPAQRSAAGTLGSHTQDHFNRNSLRSKRLMNVWRGNQRLFICSVCNKGFPRLSQLEEHKAAHQPFKPFKCLECGKSFTQKTRLKTHQRVHTGERPYSCTICGKMFSRQDNCLRHERFHSGLKPYSCRQCGKSFTVLANLKIHQEIHLQGQLHTAVLNHAQTCDSPMQ